MSTEPTPELKKLIDDFLTGFNTQNPDKIMATMTDDIIFESGSPAPNGKRFEGAAAVREVWVNFFKNRPDVHFAPEETIWAGDRIVTCWDQQWTENGQKMNVRGLDILHIRDGKIAQKLAYSKR